jgi:hypothetical protein
MLVGHQGSHFLLRRGWQWFNHHSLLLRVTLRSSRETKGGNYSSIFLRIIVVTEEEIIRRQEEGKDSRIEKLENKGKQTDESSNSNISGSGSLAAAASPDVSFPAEVLEEATSPARFLFFTKHLSPESAGGGHIVESLSS